MTEEIQNEIKDRSGLFDPELAASRILKECIWEYDIDANEIMRLARHGSAEEKRFLYGKILQNSQHLLEAVSIFHSADLKSLHSSFRAGRFRKAYLEKRNNMIGFFYFREPLRFKELKWQT